MLLNVVDVDDPRALAVCVEEVAPELFQTHVWKDKGHHELPGIHHFLLFFAITPGETNMHSSVDVWFQCRTLWSDYFGVARLVDTDGMPREWKMKRTGICMPNYVRPRVGGTHLERVQARNLLCLVE